MEIRRLDPTRLRLRDIIELADAALDAFRDDSLYKALHMHYGQRHYWRARLSYALYLASEMWSKDVGVWVALENERVVGLCRWENLRGAGSAGVSQVWIWLADAANWLLNVYARVVEAPDTRPISDQEFGVYKADISGYFASAAPLRDEPAFLGLLCARHAYKGQGVGSALLRQSLTDIAARAAPTGYALWATPAGLALYKKFGFEVRAEHSMYLNKHQVLQILMYKSHDPQAGP